uniref:CSON013705 protein n=1 Tax=Culicoides sonorensis TaxID=179676 RepID=A0A336LL39_CULSO
MWSSWSFQLILLINLAVVITKTYADHVHGCGGYIKTIKGQSNIDFSKVEVQLLTKSGVKKDNVEANPTNGYYFLPVYEKGDYVLKVVPPPGWSFEPEKYDIKFDGESDDCSLEKDINFVFKGFGITGRVNVLGQKQGASGVLIELVGKENEVLSKTTTNNVGSFSFTPLLPGEYILRASHKIWHLSKKELGVKLTTQNYVVPEKSLLVSGFDVHGKVVNDGIGIAVLIYGKKNENLQIDCQGVKLPEGVTQKNPNYDSKPLCYTTSNQKGEYTFSNVNPGGYLIQPFIESSAHKVHIAPEYTEIQVVKDTLHVSDIFEVNGITVQGRVALSENGPGVKNAKVIVNGEHVATTNDEGIYELINIKPNPYTIQVEAKDMQFDDHIARVSLTNPKIFDIKVARFKVCGQVVSDKVHTVSFTKQGSTYLTEVNSNPNTGEFCTFVAPGKYIIEVVTSSEDKNEGIQFFPVKQTIEVGSSQVSGLLFSQLRATVIGEIYCLSDADTVCDEIAVSLVSGDGDGIQFGEVTATVKNGKYSFTNVLPGPYRVSVLKPELCWEASSFQFVVKSSEEQVPKFKHTGYAVTIIASHTIQMNYKYKSPDTTTPQLEEIYELIPGVNSLCVPKQGAYDIKYSGCHTFDINTPNTFSTSNLVPISVNAHKHKHGVRILSEVSNLYSAIIEKDGEKIDEIKLLEESHKVDGYFSYRYDFYLAQGEKIKMIPSSGSMLFKPDSKEIIGSNDCVDVAFNFIATKGLVLHGKTVPVIEDAKVVLSFPKNPEMVPLETLTDKKGEFKFGPIDSTIDIELIASKESYVFSEFDKTTNSFKAHKLCEIIATVKDDQGQSLSGVLLSVSGAESYRKNLITADDGIMKFHSLAPSQYYIRPNLKEYKFEPSSKIIDLKDGETVEVSIVGKRVAYSVFGIVKSLNGEPFPKVNILANAIEPCEGMEEAQSEYNGNYRIKGLVPGCSYSVKVKIDSTSNNVDRSIPTEKIVEVALEDINGVNFIAMAPINTVDVILRIKASENDYYRTLKVALYAKNSDSPIYSEKVPSPLQPKLKINPGIMLYPPKLPLNHQQYYIEVTTALSDKQYKYHLPTIEFIANQTNLFYEISFNPQIITGDNEINSNSIPALCLIAVVGFVFFKQDLALELLETLWGKVSSIVKDLFDKSKRQEVRQAMVNEDIDELANAINATKKGRKSKKIN